MRNIVDYLADYLATILSMSKPITMLFCGITVDEGYVENIGRLCHQVFARGKRGRPLIDEVYHLPLSTIIIITNS